MNNEIPFHSIGWLIESRYWPDSWRDNPRMKRKHTEWRKWKHHIYKTEEIAKKAVNDSVYRMQKEEFRYRELFVKLIHD